MIVCLTLLCLPRPQAPRKDWGAWERGYSYLYDMPLISVNEQNKINLVLHVARQLLFFHDIMLFPYYCVVLIIKNNVYYLSGKSQNHHS